MADRATKKKQKMKGKTLALTDFLSDERGNVTGPGTSYVLAPKHVDWAAEMDKEESDDFADLDFGGGGGKNKFDRTKLPTAPKAARGADIDPGRIPSDPPYTAFIGNLPYEADEEGIKHFFRDQKVDNVRLPMENGRLRGFGYVEFEDRQSLIDGIAMNDLMMSGRKIRVDLADQHQQQGGDRDRGDFGRDAGRDDRTDNDWRRRDPLSDSRDNGRDDRYGSSDRYGDRKGGYGDRERYGGREGGGFSGRGFEDRGSRDGGRYDDRGPREGGFGSGRDNYNRYDDHGQREHGGFDRQDGSRSGGGFENFDRDRRPDRLNDDRGFDRGHDRDFGDRDRGFKDRGYDRQDRYGDRGGNRYNDRGFGSRDRYEDGASEAPSSRPRLQLQPRTKPIEVSANPDSRSSIFGSAKPVDTATKERLIEERLARERDDEKRKLDEEKENRNIGTSSGRSRRDSDHSQHSQEGSSRRRERRHSSGSSGRAFDQRSRRDSDLSNHSDTVFSGGEEPRDESKVPLSPTPREDPSVKMIPAPPPRENIWEKRKSEHKLSTSPQSDSHNSSRSDSSPATSPAARPSKVDHRSPPTPERNVWARRQQERDGGQARQTDPRSPGTGMYGSPSEIVRGGNPYRGQARGQKMGEVTSPFRHKWGEVKENREKDVPKSLDEMPKQEEKSAKDWSDSNPFAGLDEEESKDEEGGGEWQTV
ncbi:hypothetical protein ScPMuIL_013265 [Solemya velum]